MASQASALLRNRAQVGPVPMVEQHSIGRSIVLHLLPGVFIVTLFVAAASPIMWAGYPPLLAMAVAGASPKLQN